MKYRDLYKKVITINDGLYTPDGIKLSNALDRAKVNVIKSDISFRTILQVYCTAIKIYIYNIDMK